MPVSPISFPAVGTGADANPAAEGAQVMSNIQRQNIANAIARVQLQYAPQMAQQDLLTKNLANKISQAQANVAPQQQAANVNLTRGQGAQAFASAYQAQKQGGYLGAQTQLENEIVKNPSIQFNPNAGTGIWLAQHPQALQQLGQMGSQGGPTGQDLLTGIKAGLNPGYAAQISATGAQQNPQNNALAMEAQDAAMKGANMQRDLQTYDESMDKALPIEKGQIGGNVPFGISPAGSMARKASANLQAEQAAIFGGPAMTGMKISLAGNTKPDVYLPDEARHQLIPIFAGGAQRSQDYANFVSQGLSQGIPAPTLRLLWSRFNQVRPIATNGTPNPQYAGTYGDFLTPEAIAAAQSGKAYIPPNQKDLDNNSLIKIKGKDGNDYTVQRKDLDKAIKKGYWVKS